MIPGSCGPLPDHLKTSLLQAHRMSNASHGHAKVVILGNFKQCRWALHDLQNGGSAELKAVTTAESMGIKSPQTLRFEKALRSNVFPKGTANEDALLTGFYRYAMLRDYLRHANLTGHVLHLDSDSMLYADPARLAQSFRAHYPNLALSPTIHKRFLSAASMYVGSLGALERLTAFLLHVAENGTSSTSTSSMAGSTSGSGTDGSSLAQYTAWLRGFACCKPAAQGGLLPDARGEGLRPWAVNDMTLLAYYRLKHHREVGLFPLLPHGVNDSTALEGAGGGVGSHAVALPALDHPHLPPAALAEYAAAAGAGLVDSWGGWGTHLGAGASLANSSSGSSGGGVGSGGGASGGEASHELGGGSNGTSPHRATDRHAVVEQAVGRWRCSVLMRCVRVGVSGVVSAGSASSGAGSGGSGGTGECSTRPFVRCGAGADAPLHTLHLSPRLRERAADFLSAACACPAT